MIGVEPVTPRTPIVLMRSMLQRAQEDAGVCTLVTAHLTKPVRQAQLYDCIAGALDLNGPNASKADPPLAKQQIPADARILIAEDNIVNQKILLRLVQNAGCPAAPAAHR